MVVFKLTCECSPILIFVVRITPAQIIEPLPITTSSPKIIDFVDMYVKFLTFLGKLLTTFLLIIGLPIATKI